jgi:hypothetical protein
MSANSTPDALNALVRTILTKTPTKPASANYRFQTALVVREHFGGLCAYCGKRPSVEFDHAIPINQRHLGEHCIGNLIPACRECNHEKKAASRPYGLDFRQYLSDKEGGADRTGKVLDWMKKDGYTLLSDDPAITAIKALVEAVRADVVKALDKCVAEIKLRRR